jgi:hypothetical protein
VDDEMPRAVVAEACPGNPPFVLVRVVEARTTAAVERARGRTRTTAEWARLLTPFMMMMMMMMMMMLTTGIGSEKGGWISTRLGYCWTLGASPRRKSFLALAN